MTDELTIPENTLPEKYTTFNTPTVTERRQVVLAYLYSGKPTDELAERFNCTIQTIKNDEVIIRSWWRKQAGASLEEVQNKEYAFALEQRADVLDQWTKNHKGQYMQLVLLWTNRISALLGLDAPAKNINVNMDYNEFAKTQGVRVDDVCLGLVRELTAMLKNETIVIPSDELETLAQAIQERSTKDVTPEPSVSSEPLS